MHIKNRIIPTFLYGLHFFPWKFNELMYLVYKKEVYEFDRTINLGKVLWISVKSTQRIFGVCEIETTKFLAAHGSFVVLLCG